MHLHSLFLLLPLIGKENTMLVCLLIAAVFIIPLVGIILNNNEDYDKEGSIYGNINDEDKWRFL